MLLHIFIVEHNRVELPDAEHVRGLALVHRAIVLVEIREHTIDGRDIGGEHLPTLDKGLQERVQDVMHHEGIGVEL